ncbi:protein phosphatase 2C 70 [Phytophthora cinnamomi]|uniref:protein phosphatase 2C 70 n=1 Tax=Phytophthora cinnamomi TaxID=4785 RepID=UPI00355A8E42|nr:protein phosphatase 2C 70 [Phytophthora cinnamomi]
MIRGLLVFASWYVNGEWTLLEFCISNANDLTGTQLVPIHSEIVHADLMVMFLSLFGLVGHIAKERIDPTVGVFLFEAIHDNRQPIVKMAPAVFQIVRSYSDSEYRLGIAAVTEAQEAMSPMRLWTTDKLTSVHNGFVVASFYPKYILMGTLILFVVVRKIYKRIYPDPLAPSLTGRSADRSTNERAAIAQKGNLTNFEVSTGAELQTRYGLISDYKNYVFFKGLKFASPDGVYCSGYVVVNGKYLVATEDILTIVMVKAVQTRFINVYAYEVDGYTVQRTARLVYPNTFTWNDLFHLNINILA